MGVVIKDVEICYDCFLLRRKLSSLGGAQAIDKTEKCKQRNQKFLDLAKNYEAKNILQYEKEVGKILFKSGTSQKTAKEIIKDLRKYAQFKDSEY